ncbi:hypothetical protein E7X58_03665 [Streptomyces sp. A1499]|nr:hypothetical protein E7X58_03665 [Streptomyces sp. A1499]
MALPFLDEPEHPSGGRRTHQHTKDWSAAVEAADGFVCVMPMHNGGFSAPLKPPSPSSIRSGRASRWALSATARPPRAALPPPR